MKNNFKNFVLLFFTPSTSFNWD